MFCGAELHDAKICPEDHHHFSDGQDALAEACRDHEAGEYSVKKLL